MKKSKPETIRLTQELPDEEVDALLGKFVDESHYDLLIQGRDVNVYEPNGGAYA